MRGTGLSLVFVTVAGLATPAAAYIGDDDACGSVSATWNVPKGAAVASRGRGGAIPRLMDAIGEYYSHQMLSHGPGAWVSHATMKTPGVHVNPFGDDHVESSEIMWGWPGPSQINQAAAYHALYRGSGAEAVTYTPGGADGERTADYLWYTLPSCSSVSSGPCYVGVSSEEDSGAYFYIIGRKYNGTTYRHAYGFYQYQNARAVHVGDDTSALGWSQHCSTFMSWGLALATGRSITTKSYPNSVVGPAAWTLHSAVSNECEDGAGWFGGLFVDCDDVADQIVNCFTSEAAGSLNRCDDDSAGTWQAWAQTGTADSLSPDRVIGRGGSGGGPWSGQGEYPVYWNAAGNTYGCFF